MTKQETDNITLSQLVMHGDKTIYRNALSILKRLRQLPEDNACGCEEGIFACRIHGLKH